MATDLSLSIVMRLVDQARPGLASVQGQLRALGNESKKVSQEFTAQWGEMAQTARSVGIGLAAVGGGIVASLGAASKAAMEFNKSLDEVSTLVDTNIVSMKNLKAGINDLAMSTGQASEALVGGMYQAISAGIDAGEAVQFMGVAARAAVAGVTDAETAVNGLTNVINAWQLSASDATAVADAMFVAVKGGKTTFEELSDFMFQVAPAAAAVKVSFQEVMAGLSTLTAAGTPTRVAATQLRAALVGLQRPSKEMSAIFEALGFRSAQAAIEQEGLGFALKAVADAAAGDSGKLMELLGSVEAVQAAQVIAGTGAEKFAKDLKAQKNAVGAADEAYRKMAAGGAAATRASTQSSIPWAPQPSFVSSWASAGRLIHRWTQPTSS